MDLNAITQLIQTKFPGDHLETSYEGSHLSVLLVSESFRGVSPVKKQQMVYAAVNERIASGEVHAVHMKLFTPEEYTQR